MGLPCSRSAASLRRLCSPATLSHTCTRHSLLNAANAAVAAGIPLRCKTLQLAPHRGASSQVVQRGCAGALLLVMMLGWDTIVVWCVPAGRDSCEGVAVGPRRSKSFLMFYK